MSELAEVRARSFRNQGCFRNPGAAKRGIGAQAEQAARECVSLPIFPEMSNAGKNQIANKFAPGVLSSTLGKISKDPPPHGSDVF